MEKSFMHDTTFQTKIVLCAEKIGNRAAGRKCAVNEACIGCISWPSQKESEIG
jgi:hypothetical protein